MATELDTKDFKVKSVGNTVVLAETALIEAFNLKSAIEYVTNTICVYFCHNVHCNTHTHTHARTTQPASHTGSLRLHHFRRDL
jgi:hypothetical protein